MSAILTHTGFQSDEGAVIHKQAERAKRPAKAGEGQDVQVRRYAMQREAQKVLTGFTYTRKRDGVDHGCTYRVTRCHRNPNSRAWNPGVDVMHYPDTGRYGYGNLVTCGSTWHCPICSPKITEYRRAELAAGAASIMGRDGEIAMVTLTYRHSIDLPLAESLKAFYKAREKFFAGRAFKDAMRDVGAVGRVYSTEVTFGVNGWHPHIHVLVLCEKRIPGIVERLARLRDQWARSVVKSGLGLINEHGFDVRNGDYAAEYIAKYGHEPAVFTWSAAHELTKSHVKQGRAGNLTPFDLLGILATRQGVEVGDRIIGPAEAENLFREYAVQFQGRQQLYWSKGLREQLGLENDRTDEEVADGEGDSDIIGTITSDEWREVLRLNGRGQILAMLGKYGRQALPEILALLPKLNPNRPDEPWFREENKFRGY
ncbi:MAG: hypothetical protein PHQ05_06530 [Sterolibacterium sp.]|nr:hypothetical protein [Sterolibacterium sp.]